MKKYVWLDTSDGEFSDSWTEDAHERLFPSVKGILDNPNFKHLKLIEYNCLNDETFELSENMKIVTE